MLNTQGAFLGINFHTTPHRSMAASSSTEFSSFLSSSAADRYVEALSDIMTYGKDLQLENLWKARRKVSTDRSVTTSRWTALVVAHVNRHM